MGLPGDRDEEAHDAQERQEAEHPPDEPPEIASGDRHSLPPSLVASAMVARRQLIQLTTVDGLQLEPAVTPVVTPFVTRSGTPAGRVGDILPR
jgi:hypothetical protein